MFGISSTELIIVAIILIVVVGPDHMPTLMKKGGQLLRQFRRASDELRRTIGLDELLRDEELRRPLDAVPSHVPHDAEADDATTVDNLDYESLEQEVPAEGVDIVHAEQRTEAQTAQKPSS